MPAAIPSRGPDVTRWWQPWELGGPDHRPERPTLRAALQAFHTAIRGRPSDAVRSAPSVLPGRKAVVIPGQLDIEHDDEARGP